MMYDDDDDDDDADDDVDDDDDDDDDACIMLLLLLFLLLLPIRLNSYIHCIHKCHHTAAMNKVEEANTTSVSSSSALVGPRTQASSW